MPSVGHRLGGNQDGFVNVSRLRQRFPTSSTFPDFVNSDPSALAEAAHLIRDRAVAVGLVAGKVHDMESANLREILRRLGHTVAITPQPGQLVNLGLHGINTAPWPTVHPIDRHYITASDGGRVVIGDTIARAILEAAAPEIARLGL